MRLSDRLLRPATLSGAAMLLVAIANIDAKRYVIGTPHFIDEFGGLDFLDALLIIAGGLLLYAGTFRRAPVKPLPFAILTTPLLMFMAATSLYVVSGDVAKSGLPIYALAYLLLIAEVRRRYKRIEQRKRRSVTARPADE